ncbi:MAG: hypothetical protein AAGA24_04475 [Pseudomonadota bacterium]
MARLILAWLIGASFALATAQDSGKPNPVDQRIIHRISQADLEMIVTSLGHEIEARQNLGEVSLIARSDDGTLYLLIGSACEVDAAASAGADPLCYGLNMQVRYGADEHVTLKKINAVNLARVAVTVWRADDTLGISRFVILDGGQSVANIKENLFNLLGIAPYVVDTMWPPVDLADASSGDDVITLSETGE